MVRRCWSVPSPLSWGFRIGQSQREFAACVAREAQQLPGGHRERGAPVLRADRQLPLAAIDQRGELDLPGAPVVEQLVHGGSHRAPGIEDVVDYHDVTAVDV